MFQDRNVRSLFDAGFLVFVGWGFLIGEDWMVRDGWGILIGRDRQ